MNIKAKILIDKAVAKPVAYLMNFVVRIVGKILSIDHNLNRDFKTVAICKFKGMGSILQSTPMIYAIKKRYPNAQIIYVSTQANRKILEKIEWIDTIVTIDDSSFFKFIFSNIKSLLFLVKIRPEVYFDLEIYSDFSTLFALFTLSVNRVGFYLRSSSFRMGIYTQMMFFNPRVPISEVYLQLTRLIGCEADEAVLYHFEKSVKKMEKEYIVINPNASDLRLERRLSKEKFIDLIKMILEDFPGFDVILIGSRDEKPYTAEISSQIDDKRLKNTAGTTTIEELIDIIANAKLMITNDTGPMHIAFSTKTPVICLFGPCSPEQYGMTGNAFVIYKQVYCSPCVHDFEVPPCKGENVCMDLISADEIFEKLTQLLKNPTGFNPIKSTDFIFKKGNNIFGQVNR